MGKWMHWIYFAALVVIIIQAFELFQVIPDGFLEYFVILVGVLMALTPVESLAMRRGRALRGLPGSKMLGLPTRLWFVLFGVIVVLMGLISAGMVGSSLGSVFAQLSIYTLAGKGILIGIAAIYAFSTLDAGKLELASI